MIKNVEIDACAISQNTAIIGEAKWVEKKVDRRDIEKFIAKSQIVTQELREENWIGIILSKRGFTKAAKNSKAKT